MKKFFLIFALLNVTHTLSMMHDHSLISTKNNHEMTMYGMYGHYPMGRDATGTSWMPGSTKMPAIHRTHDDWLFMIHGYGMVIYDHQSGPRGAKKVFSENMFMATAQKETDNGTLAFRMMVDLEPAMGPSGYPLLLQTGETANGITPLIDRQHPHDLFMELALVYSRMISEKSSVFAYFAMPGEPALGPPVYIHRFSAFFNPEAPITHHWLDSTHISFGVATLGFVHDGLKIDASIFNGREPDQHRWNFEKPRFDSYSIRLSLNPTENIAAQISYGFLKSPELLDPNLNTHRTTASISYNKAWDNNNWQTTFAWGRNHNVPGHTLNGYLLESAVELHSKHVIFARAEYVAKDELFLEPDPRAGKVFNVGKIDAGYIYEFPFVPLTQWGIGFVASASFVPKSIRSVYGGIPISYMFFLRVEFNE